MMQRILALVVLVAAVHGFSVAPDQSCHRASTQLTAQEGQGEVSRASFLTTAFSAAVFSTMAPLSASAAKEIDPKLKGTKQDPGYEACVSKCLYECTKPKGDEQKDRKECIPICKKQCATTKEQLMVGTPLAK
eukprot:CAMPEP_0195255936 /NCGR_PEP_ID=MMETSP0706-20130129/5943_1 /TAXON_ID=33640 /ORGANISM="Asterionellopsis glacialis, Strain CCMP134" /LENGTH=132 /DNA_ID=CAMNT_0040308895 /DNA_START=25 /DNA_END=423 /DNA_ORIENTATION=+